MAGRIYLLGGSEGLVPLEQAPYDTEALLQELLATHPDLLAGGQGGEEPRWALVSREMAVPDEDGGGGRWSLDHLFIDQDGVPTLVEVKRSTDTRIRREMVGQMLDYAANAVAYWPMEKLQAGFDKLCEGAGRDPADVLADLRGDDVDVDEYWQRVKTNLQAGRIRMVFVADALPNELVRIIEFLNGQMDPAEVIGVEVQQYVGDGVKTLVPRRVGETEAARSRKKPSSGKREPITEQQFFEVLSSEQPAEVVPVVKALVDWCRRAQLSVDFRSGANGVVVIPLLTLRGSKIYPISVQAQNGVVMQMRWLHKHPPFDQPDVRDELQRRLSQLDGFELRGGMTKMPKVPFVSLLEPAALASLLETLDWLMTRLHASDLKG